VHLEPAQYKAVELLGEVVLNGMADNHDVYMPKAYITVSMMSVVLVSAEGKEK